MTWYLASYAQDLAQDCVTSGPFMGVSWGGGQEFDTDNYNVVVNNQHL
jgi:hypothetical protein